MKKYLCFVLLIRVLFLGVVVFCQDFTPKGKYNNIVNHQYYTLSYSEEHEQAEWVMYKLEASKLKPEISRTNNFRPDNLISEGSAGLNDYRGSGYDRGHLAPAADMKYSENSMSESFFMSNMSPQLPGFNRQIWRIIEAKFRNWGHQYNEIVIITGPVLNGEYIDTIGENSIVVPKFFYKVAIDPDNLKRNIAVLIENKASINDIQDYIVTIDELEDFTGIDFFERFNDKIESEIESSTHIDLWDWQKSIPKYSYEKTTVTKDTKANEEKANIKGDLFKTRTGTKYHRGSCRYLSRSQIPIKLEEAKKEGLGPCSVCKPKNK